MKTIKQEIRISIEYSLHPIGVVNRLKTPKLI